MTEHELTLTATASDGQTTQNTHVNVPDVILIDRALLTELTEDRERLNRELQAIWEQLAPYAKTEVFCLEIELGKILDRMESQAAAIERLKADLAIANEARKTAERQNAALTRELAELKSRFDRLTELYREPLSSNP